LIADAVARHLLNSSIFAQSKAIACYLSLSEGEVSTWAIALEILRRGKLLFVPRINKDKPTCMQMLRIYNEEDLLSLPLGTWGIREPTPTYLGGERTVAGDLDDHGLNLVLLPGKWKQMLKVC